MEHLVGFCYKNLISFLPDSITYSVSDIFPKHLSELF